MNHRSAGRCRAGSTRAWRLIWPIVAVAAFAGCTAMEGVNVGANIPIGGIVSVGANKTIGDARSPAPSQKKPAEKSEDSTSEEEE